MRWMAAAVLGTVSSSGWAQQIAVSPASAETIGTIVGHVYLADTGGPARLAQVALQPVQVPSDDAKKGETHQRSSFQVYRTGLDGGYRIAHVKPGSYYVVVRCLGTCRHLRCSPISNCHIRPRKISRRWMRICRW